MANGIPNPGLIHSKMIVQAIKVKLAEFNRSGYMFAQHGENKARDRLGHIAQANGTVMRQHQPRVSRYLGK